MAAAPRSTADFVLRAKALLEYGEGAKDHFRYVMSGTMDKPGELPPKGEFYCVNPRRSECQRFGHLPPAEDPGVLLVAWDCESMGLGVLRT